MGQLQGRAMSLTLRAEYRRKELKHSGVPGACNGSILVP
jgi:hypothetical protein